MVRRRREAVEQMDVATTKSTQTDIVTASDLAAEALIRDQLLTARPNDGFLGEENGHTPGQSGVDWIVDPIDGTVNYLYGIRQYAVSIAARIDGVVQAAVVHNPATDETWSAVLGGGAYVNDRPIRVSACRQLGMALVGTGFGYRATRRAHQAAALPEIVPAVRDIRRFGSAALDLCWVACARLDGYYERGLKPWDKAAGALVAAEAGAVVTGLGEPDGDAGLLVAATPGIANELWTLLKKLGADRDTP
jgi:myo-inositol-1(or 4)-monophosphatase